MGAFQKIGVQVPQNGWLNMKIVENPIFSMDDLGGKPTILGNTHIFSWSLPGITTN